MTADDYRRRVEHGFAAAAFSNTNPYRATISERLASMGGLHRAPQTADDRITMADEDAVSLMRELPAALTEVVQEF